MEFPCIVPHFASIRAVIGRKRAGAPPPRGHIRGKLSISGVRIAIHFLHPHAQLYCTCACACACACACICAACGTRDMKKKTKSYILP